MDGGRGGGGGMEAAAGLREAGSSCCSHGSRLLCRRLTEPSQGLFYWLAHPRGERRYGGNKEAGSKRGGPRLLIPHILLSEVESQHRPL